MWSTPSTFFIRWPSRRDPECSRIGATAADLYAPLNAPPLSRLTRFSSLDLAGVYRSRHDFAHSIPAGAHGVNQIAITGDTLYVGIGAARRTGNPAEQNIYTMTLARIADLGSVDFSGPSARTSRDR